MTLNTDKHASVPELQNLTISTDGTLSMTIFAKVFSNSHGAPKEVPFSSCLINAALTWSLA
jgi:hypothetical protein